MKVLRASESAGLPAVCSAAIGLGIIEPMSPAVHSQVVKAAGRDIGFDRVGITSADPLERASYYRDWLAAGHAGAMTYLTRNVEMRCDPRRLMDGARAIICVALNYRRADERRESSEATGQVAMYARGRDYHVVMRRMMRELIVRLHEQIALPFEAAEYVDTGPLLERELAARAGLGWIGKNTCLLHERSGSYLFLGEIVTTLDLAPDQPLADHCGTCTRCLDACPTDAFIGPYQLNASRCIAYQTIENRGEIPADVRAGMGDWVFGCDVCQDVCPYNSRAPLSSHAELGVHRVAARIPLASLIKMTSGDHKRLTKGTATARVSRRMWQRNARIALENSTVSDA